jgi:2-dehydro-3-deoxy-D-gluconate 5-dehydrogenase
MFSLEGRRALVTGANTGIGQAIAVALAEAGARVTCAGRSDMTETLAKVPGGEALRLDFADPMAAAGIFAGEGYDILVNNAGIIRRADAVDFPEADWDAVMDVNLKAAFFTCQAFAKEVMATGGTGRIVNIASLLSFQGGIRVPSYTASKHGIAGITKLLANEWAAKGINVNADRAGLCRDQQHRGPARRPVRNQVDPRPHPRRPLGRARRHRRRRGLPRLARGGLRARRDHPRRRRLACPLRPSRSPA